MTVARTAPLPMSRPDRDSREPAGSLHAVMHAGDADDGGERPRGARTQPRGAASATAAPSMSARRRHQGVRWPQVAMPATGCAGTAPPCAAIIPRTPSHQAQQVRRVRRSRLRDMAAPAVPQAPRGRPGGRLERQGAAPPQASIHTERALHLHRSSSEPRRGATSGHVASMTHRPWALGPLEGGLHELRSVGVWRGHCET
jgi:hypothetical protein